MAKEDFYFGDLTVEALLIPDLTFNQPALPGTEWEEFQIPPNTVTPANSPVNWEWGIRFAENIGGWDSSFSYLYAWDQFPGAFRGAFGSDAATLTFTPRYTRLHTFGLTTSKNIEGAVLGIETAYVHGKYIETGIDSNHDGVLDEGDTFGESEQDTIAYGVSADFNWKETDITFQYSQTILPHYQPDLMTDQVVSGASLFIRKQWLNNRLLTQFSTLYFFNHEEALIRPRVEYKWSDHLKLSTGADLFSGHHSSSLNSEFDFIGFFKDHDRIIGEARYSF
jgi:hypothetical protein